MSSSMIAKAAALKPEIRLAQSVSEFEASLSDKHKATFRSYRSQSLNRPLDTSDVMRLTAEIDRRAIQKNGGGQCFGPRLTNILQAVQQYAALGDVIVGGSQNIIACGIWSLLRLTLLALVSFSSYMEKLSRLLMVAGRKAPRYEQMALLYSRSSDLQSSLSEYFIVVVQLCRKLYEATQKSTLGSYFSFLSDLDLKEHETDLKLWGDCIKDEVTLLTARKITEQNTFLGVLSKSSDYQSHRKRLRTRLRILEACSTYDHQTTWKEIRKSGNSTIVAQLNRYPEWKAETTSSTLLCTGKLGVGKSVLLANVVDELNLSTRSSTTAVIYFFCRHDIQESLRARTIIGSVARQIIDANLSQVPYEAIETSSVLDLDDLLAFVLRMVPRSKEIFLLLDGLDECDDLEREVTLKCLRRLQKEFSLKICCSFRSDVHLKGAEEAADILIRSSVANLPEENPDITAFITAELQRCIASGRLCVGDSRLVSEIQDALVNRAEARSDAEIREALENLPRGLPETFSRILQKSRGGGERYQKLILQLCMIARRPLTTEELREALSVTPYNTDWNPARLINNILSVLSFCGSLITIDEENLKVRFLHHSVKQYLLGDFDVVAKPLLTREDADRAMGEVIVTYLNYNTFENAVSRATIPEMMAQNMPTDIVKSTFRDSTPVRRVALSIFRRQQSSQHDLRYTLIPARKPSNQNIQFEFHAYAQAYWLWHLQWVFSHQYPGTLELLKTILRKGRVNINDEDEHGETILFRAVEFASSEVVKQLLDYGSAFRTVGANGRTVLHLAATRGSEDIITYLLDRCANSSNQDKDHCTPLLLAASMGHQAAAHALMKSARYDEIDIKNKLGRTAASMAAYKGHLTILESLSEKGAYTETVDNDNWTPLSLAAGAGHTVVVDFLLNRGARVTAVDNDGWTALHWSAYKGHDDVAQSLLDRNANIEAKNKDAWTPLLLAAARGHKTVVESLIDRGANFEAEAKDGRSALQIARDEGHETISKLLSVRIDTLELERSSSSGNTAYHPSDKNHLTLARNQESPNQVWKPSRHADAISQISANSTQLFWAADNGYEVLMAFLMGRGFDIDVPDELGATPLLRASANGHISIVKILHRNGANIHARTIDGKTVLHIAAERGHLIVMQYFLATRADIIARDFSGRLVDIHAKSIDGRTALHISAKRGDRDIVQLLLENGARDGDTTPGGRTALHVSAEWGHLPVVECLLDNGADMGIRTVDGKTALILATEKGNGAVVRWLRKRGAATYQGSVNRLLHNPQLVDRGRQRTL